MSGNRIIVVYGPGNNSNCILATLNSSMMMTMMTTVLSLAGVKVSASTEVVVLLGATVIAAAVPAVDIRVSQSVRLSVCLSGGRSDQ